MEDKLWTRREIVRGSANFGFGILGGIVSIFGSRAVERLFASQHHVSYSFSSPGANIVSMYSGQMKQVFDGLVDFGPESLLTEVVVENDGDLKIDAITFRVSFSMDEYIERADDNQFAPYNTSIQVGASNTALLGKTTAVPVFNEMEWLQIGVDVTATDFIPGSSIGISMFCPYQPIRISVSGQTDTMILQSGWSPPNSEIVQ